MLSKSSGLADPRFPGTSEILYILQNHLKTLLKRTFLRCGPRPELINEISRRFGSQCMVLSIEAKQTLTRKWEVYTDNGRERTGIDVVDWVKKAVDLGAGEILLTSVDREGTRKGYDVPLIEAVTKEVSVPVIASGGMGVNSRWSIH